MFTHFEEAKIKHKIIEFFASKTETQLTTDRAIERLAKELRRKLNRMINREDEEEVASTSSPPSMSHEGGGMTSEGSSVSAEAPEPEEEDPHPITEVYFTQFVMQ